LKLTMICLRMKWQEFSDITNATFAALQKSGEHKAATFRIKRAFSGVAIVASFSLAIPAWIAQSNDGNATRPALANVLVPPVVLGVSSERFEPAHQSLLCSRTLLRDTDVHGRKLHPQLCFCIAQPTVGCAR
jgi:hypothetical protein